MRQAGETWVLRQAIPSTPQGPVSGQPPPRTALLSHEQWAWVSTGMGEMPRASPVPRSISSPRDGRPIPCCQTALDLLPLSDCLQYSLLLGIFSLDATAALPSCTRLPRSRERAPCCGCLRPGCPRWLPGALIWPIGAAMGAGLARAGQARALDGATGCFTGTPSCWLGSRGGATRT